LENVYRADLRSPFLRNPLANGDNSWRREEDRRISTRSFLLGVHLCHRRLQLHVQAFNFSPSLVFQLRAKVLLAIPELQRSSADRQDLRRVVSAGANSKCQHLSHRDTLRELTPKEPSCCERGKVARRFGRLRPSIANRSKSISQTPALFAPGRKLRSAGMSQD
jgi:hypothetical protein